MGVLLYEESGVWGLLVLKIFDDSTGQLKCRGVWSGDSVCRLHARERKVLWKRFITLQATKDI